MDSFARNEPVDEKIRNRRKSMRSRLAFLSLFLVAFLSAVSIHGQNAVVTNNPAARTAPVDLGKLPPASTNVINFDRDILPIFSRSCFRCHGPERPKSKFRLDNQNDALTGGEDSKNDIIPGDSAHSELVWYVTGLVRDMEMPPPGKGERLSAAEIGTLRAWIDQGASWGATAEPNVVQGGVELIGGGYIVNGNQSMFRELFWKHEGWEAGLGEFDFSQNLDDRTKASVNGHVLRDDVRLNLLVERYSFGFVRLGVEQYRKYFSDAGGYYPYSPPEPTVQALGQDLFLNIGKASIDIGFTLPTWPKMTVGYEFQRKEGTEATLEWGRYDGVVNGVSTPRNVLPATKYINEQVNLIKFDLDYQVGGFRFEDNFRGEFYDLNTEQTDPGFFSPSDPSLNRTNLYGDSYNHFQGANTFRIERSFTDWIFASAGYLYSHLSGDAGFNADTIGDPTSLFYFKAHLTQLVLDQEAQVGSVNTLLGPWDGLSLFGGVQGEWSRQKGFGNYIDESLGPGQELFTSMSSDLNRTAIQESAGLRYTKIPFTVLFAEGRLEQESIGQFEQQGSIGGFGFNPDDLARDTDATGYTTDLRAGFNSSPWRPVSFGSSYRWYDKSSHYNNIVDLDGIGLPGLGYSAFIRAREVRTDEIELKLVLHTTSWLKTTFKYQKNSTDYTTDTDPVPIPALTNSISLGGPLLAGTYRADIYSVNFSLTPIRRFYLSTTFAYTRSKTQTADNGDPSVVPYEGEIYSAIVSGTYLLSDRSDFRLSYVFSAANYAQDNLEAGLPVGIEYRQHGIQAALTRRFSKLVSAGIRYGFYLYDEPSSGHFNDFTAQSILATLTLRWPTPPGAPSLAAW